jgi:hypothetical protein
MATRTQDTPGQEPDLENPSLEQQPTEELEVTNNQPGGPTSTPGPSPEYVALLETQLREQNRQIQELINRDTGAPEPPPPPRDIEASRQQWYQDPEGRTLEVTRNVVREELQATVAPLLDFVREFKSGNAYEDMKRKFKSDARFAGQFADPAFEAAVDQIMAKADKTEANMQAALIHAIGLKAINALPASNGNTTVPAPTPTPQPPAATTTGERPVAPQPPHLRPSTAPAARADAPKRRQLNELERRLARERWPNDPQAEEKYLNWLELPASDVVRADETGKVKPK